MAATQVEYIWLLSIIVYRFDLKDLYGIVHMPLLENLIIPQLINVAQRRASLLF